MNFKSWGVGAAVVAGVVMSFAGSAWYFARPSVDSAANEKPAVDLAAKNLAEFANPFASKKQEIASVTGRWVGDVDLGGGMVRLTFNLNETDGRLTGSVTFPIGEADIQDGKIDGNQLSFTTQHRLASTGQKIDTRYVGTVADNGIELMMSGAIETNVTIKRIAY